MPTRLAEKKFGGGAQESPLGIVLFAGLLGGFVLFLLVSGACFCFFGGYGVIAKDWESPHVYIMTVSLMKTSKPMLTFSNGGHRL
jgi:hypothetical protein